MRTAPLTLRLQAVTLRPPRHRSAKHLAAVAVTAVWAHEAAPPPGCTPSAWLRLTTGPVTTAEQAGEGVAW